MKIIFRGLKYLTVITLMLLIGCNPTNKLTEDKRSSRNIVSPNEPIILFNGKDLSGFYTWLGDYHYDDPDNVFSIVDRIDGAPAIRISGEHWGGLITEDHYADYHLIVEYRWGLVTWGERKKRARDSGILIHAEGPEGNFQPDFNSPWMRSIEFQIMEGATGDFILLGGYTDDGDRISTRMTISSSSDREGAFIWDPVNGEPRQFDVGPRNWSGINWYGRDPDWEDIIDFKSNYELENPIGQWNRLEIYSSGNNLTYLVNGRIVNRGITEDLTNGKLLFQSEGAEVFFRRIELHPHP